MNILPQQIKSLVNYGPRDYRLETLPLPEPKARELLVKVGACGICASDVHCWHGAPMYWGDGNPEKAWVKTPVVVGHEFYGTVVGYGEGALEHFGVSPGDRVIAEQIIPCNQCRFCKDGKYWMCEKHDIYGFQTQDSDGGMTEYMLFKANSRVHKIPDTLTHEECALIEPFACAVHAVNRAAIEFNDVVVLAGAGPLGTGMIQAIRLKNPKLFIVLDTIPERLALAKKLGADLVFNPLEQDVDAEVRKLTDGYGCDIYIEATGNPLAVNQGLQMIRRMGRYVEFSVFGKPATVDWSIIGDRKELDVRGSHLGPHCYETVISFFEKKWFTAEGIVTHSFPLAEWEQGFAMASGRESIKVLLVP
ncbi:MULTISPECIES: alcohol dehydrogenase catalytic domain-containing protein [Pantoea]|jgi:L-iditol 2-dehydrogenase|uniref:alcohol dehydrogenase catalytic domain-containing protein n=1 Tax=Pantoea TaxID=53335 RepID=UPI000535BDE5|nr:MULTISPECIES: alcohol dehydrogenase catalytic domain-containing protein [Pantoea]PPS64665.1 erythritol/L-threitol dehydrogenase [Pantoea sp. BRM17]AIX49094.1 iditol 2-dehydrogenase [Pantoea sp. PSNIH1]KAA5965177.1 alcohol dehydrogenase catalytic domain-containing protein [Pantoea sp. M_9]MCL9647414.1 alcohol dehydrogenase catalytic domain-containing protein [Pantoea eucrina]MDJ0023973.1 alcohol dehydrogenase catalytic domain-containing protein [Pantoea eucrina]